MIKDKKHIIYLMARAAVGVEMLPEERAELEEWLDAAPENRSLFEKIQTFQSADEILRLERAGYARRTADRVLRQIGVSRGRKIVARWVAWASGVAAVLALGFGIWLGGQREERRRFALVEPVEEIMPGKVEAVLTFAGGEKLHISDTTRPVVWQEKLKQADEVSWHTLSVPAGGEFYYVLPDGTRVWINAASELRFPSGFSGEQRRVELRGEAFFDVVHDGHHPFVVGLSGGDITVYGTRFNVTDYEDTDLSAVLVEGSIGFRSEKGQQVRLSPSERVVYDADKETLSVEKVDTELYTAWVDRRFVFEGQTLENIMSTLARWYDFNITFADEDIRTIRLSGRLNRYDDIRVLLHTYENVANIQFDIQGKNIIVSHK